MNPKIKEMPVQKDINNFFAIQLRRVTRENNKSSSKITKRISKSSKGRNKWYSK